MRQVTGSTTVSRPSLPPAQSVLPVIPAYLSNYVGFCILPDRHDNKHYDDHGCGHRSVCLALAGRVFQTGDHTSWREESRKLIIL